MPKKNRVSEVAGDDRYHIYTFENRCIQDFGLALGDETVKIVLNTKGTADDVSPEMKRLLEFIDGQKPADAFTEELAKAVQSVRDNEKWRVLDIQWMSVKHRPERSGEGLEQGLKREKLETARRLLDMETLSIEEIAEATELPIEKIREIAGLQML